MSETILTVSILGVGQRGCAYADVMMRFPNKYKIVSVCDTITSRSKTRGEKYKVDESLCFTDENIFFQEKRSELLVIATQDRDHVRQAIKALELGYDILLEKPISPDKNDLIKLANAHKKYGHKILVCHVLRYSPAFEKVKEILDSGVLGQIIMIDDIENVQYQHQSHSFVRGNWRNKEETSPMIMAKCCHDLDLITWFSNSKCKSVSSFGDLSFFKEENQPEGASDRCTTCKLIDSCPYSAKRIYIDDQFWGRKLITDADPNTDEAVYEALKTGPYGRCVFKCDNDVVDHQVVTMQYENGIVANLRMTAFMDASGRVMHIFGTYGDLLINEDNDEIIVHQFGNHTPTIYKISSLADTKSSAHGGADLRMIEELYGIIKLGDPIKTDLDLSIESHLIALASEESRLQKGKLIQIER